MCIVSFLKSAFCVRHCFVQGSEKSGLLVLCLLLHCSCSFGTENQTFLLNFTVEKVNCFIKKWSMIQSMATLGKELTGEWKKCSLEAGALWNFWLWQQSNVLCRQKAWRVDAAVSTAFPTCGARAQSQLYWLRQLFSVYLHLQLQLLLDELCPSWAMLLHWPEQLNCTGRSPCCECRLGQMKVPQAFSSVFVWSYCQCHIMGQMYSNNILILYFKNFKS